MGEIYNRGDIVVSKDKNKPTLRILKINDYEDEKEELKLIEFDESKLKQFKHKTTDEIAFILQVLGSDCPLERDDIQKLFKSNFTFDYNLYTFNTILSDGGLCVIQIIEESKGDDNRLKIIISNKVRSTQMSRKVKDISECYQNIELYLIRNKPTLNFNYFKENLDKYRKEIVKANPVEEVETEKESENNSEDSKVIEVPNKFFDDINPAPSENSEDIEKVETEDETETVVESEEQEQEQEKA